MIRRKAADAACSAGAAAGSNPVIRASLKQMPNHSYPLLLFF
jgi:hypothetical protein